MTLKKPWFLFNIKQQVAVHVVIDHRLSGIQYGKASSDIQVQTLHYISKMLLDCHI
ncbi:Hypersensitive-induced response protein 2 [Senna tora]|uniref:Hypersensitive-induced response protein 2 n=1 Tax=Senna tora TaxID=362788 RepID=A0A834W833_9FABA|nr:Hypersensitive-induced response protein 2 [Senna tora]